MAGVILCSSLALDEFLSLVLCRPTTDEIIAFRVSAEVQERIFDLLGRNSEGALTDDERADCNALIRFERMASLLKAKALLKMASDTETSST
jgi:uncharacterized protein YbjQ (UPF0145 family)